MDILFIHQNMPGQYKHLAPALARGGKHRVAFITKRKDVELPGVRRVLYEAPRAAARQTHHYLRLTENAVRHGQQVARQLITLKQEGFNPRVVVAHPGWGESLFVKDVLPNAALLSYAEFYYHGRGADVGFDPAQPPELDAICRARARNAHLLLSLEAADMAVSPTFWQMSRHPAALQAKIRVIFDGIDTNQVRPDPNAVCTLPDGASLSAGDEVLTYVARNLEPYRGFPSFIRALPRILDERPGVKVVIVGGDEVSYGSLPEGGGSWRDAMLKEVPLDQPPYAGRVHFTGKLPYRTYLQLLQVSTVHTYLTYPFVLSWSCFEAMAAGCLIVASDTEPVREALTDGHNALLVPFFQPDLIASRIIEALSDPQRFAGLRKAARETVIERYELADCLKRQTQLITNAAQLYAR